MIIYQDDFLNENEISYLLNLWDKSLVEFSDYAISFYYINLIENPLDLTTIHNGVFRRKDVVKMRLQLYNESFNQIDYFHGHENLHNYIIFLNDNFRGGELEFENGLLVKPKKGSLVYFNNNEKHKVHPCVGDRYVFTALGDKELDIQYQIKKREKKVI